MTAQKFDRVISGDSHVREPVDLWWKAMGAKYGDRTPRPLTEHEGRKGSFFFSGQRVSKHGVAVKPAGERTEEEELILQSGFDPDVRLEFQRRAGIAAEIIYPSLAAQIIAMIMLVAITFPPASTDPASTSITTLSSTRLPNHLTM